MEKPAEPCFLAAAGQPREPATPKYLAPYKEVTSAPVSFPSSSAQTVTLCTNQIPIGRLPRAEEIAAELFRRRRQLLRPAIALTLASLALISSTFSSSSLSFSSSSFSSSSLSFSSSSFSSSSFPH